MSDTEQQAGVKATQEIDLNTTVDVPMADGTIVKKRLLELTQDDLRALAEQRRAREASQAEGRVATQQDDPPGR